MRIVVLGGSGLIGSKTVEKLRKLGHTVVSASSDTGVDILTGEGLAKALVGAEVVIDLVNSRSFEESAVVEFFETAGHNLFAAEAAAGVGHHVALSVVGTEHLRSNGYFRGKGIQEDLIRKSGIPYTIVHSTQFFEFTGAIAQSGADGNVTRVSPAYYQPIFSGDVAEAMAAAALRAPMNGIVEIGGPEKVRMSELVTRYLKAMKDPRTVISDKSARYFGYEIDDQMLVPGKNAQLGATRFDEWLKGQATSVAAH